MKTSEVHIKISEHVILEADLRIPAEPAALVIFSHGSGSSRFSPRNRLVAEALNTFNIATALTDLLTRNEDKVYENRFNIGLLADRLVAVTNHITKLSDFRNLPIGYFGASTGCFRIDSRRAPA